MFLVLGVSRRKKRKHEEKQGKMPIRTDKRSGLPGTLRGGEFLSWEARPLICALTTTDLPHHTDFECHSNVWDKSVSWHFLLTASSPRFKLDAVQEPRQGLFLCTMPLPIFVGTFQLHAPSFLQGARLHV